MCRKIYIEVGVCDLKFNTIPFYESHKDEDWLLYLFEPNPLSFNDISIHAEELKIPNLKVYDQAAWDEDCHKEFWLGVRHNKDGSLKGRGSASLFSGKSRLGKEKSNVKCIDFDKWLRENLLKDDYVYLRMDIEGAEYNVLPKMIEGGSMEYINCLSIEFHAHKFRGENSGIFIKKHKELKEYFKDCKHFDFLKVENIGRV
jgi:FkbM family methyltransferase